MTDTKTPWDGYRTIPERPEHEMEKGVRCGKCGMTFDHGKAYGYACPHASCPVFVKATS